MKTHYPGIRKILSLMFLLLMITLPITTPGEAATDYVREKVEYQMPDVILVNQDGEKINFKETINSGKPVILDFIYGTCTTICPVLSIGFSHFQKKLGPGAQDVHLISISIDPDNDTPLVMTEYLERYDARPGWDFLTGKREDIFKVMRAFDAFVTNKMDHSPLTFLHAPGNGEWVRISELLSSSDLMKEYNLIRKKIEPGEDV